MLRACALLLACFGAAGSIVNCALATEPEQPASIIAAHIRFQGYRCDEPRGAQREVPEAPIWVVNCGNARYRLRLVPGQAVDVEPLK